MELGEPVVVEIFDGMDPNQTFQEQGDLTQILQKLAKFTAQEALERLQDPNPFYVRRMIRIIRKMGNSDSAQQIRSLMDHKDLDVRMEALATLLKFNNKWGQVHLRELLADPLGEAFAKAVQLAGRYRSRAAVSRLEAIAMHRGERQSREAAIRALGRIGDPGTIVTLSKIARRRWSFAQKHNLYLKRVIFDTLGGYPGSAIQDLLHYGLRQKDEVIQQTCRQLLRKGG
jgi:HEAT repeat protein